MSETAFGRRVVLNNFRYSLFLLSFGIRLGVPGLVRSILEMSGTTFGRRDAQCNLSSPSAFGYILEKVRINLG